MGYRLGARCTIGWDVGGVNTKVARAVSSPAGAAAITAVRIRPFEIQRDPTALAALLRALADDVGAAPDDAHAVTMTAELSQVFRTKGDGVAFVLDALEDAFPGAATQILGTDAEFHAPCDARANPLLVAAANWVATAALLADHVSDTVLIDIGTTTTDIIPIVGGRVASIGRTDPARLLSGELLYLGAVRTPVEAVVHAVPYNGGWAGVSAESFALMGDIHVWRGTIPSSMYTAPTPDGRPATREWAGDRIARIVCGDRTMLDDAALDAIADHVAAAQLARTATTIATVLAAHPSIGDAVVAGVGAQVARAAAERAGLPTRALGDVVGRVGDGADAAPAAAVALLLADALGAQATHAG
jgi:probable H4MPT-linked C1 transfer pathway protein